MTMVGVCETRAEPSDNGLTELKRGTGSAKTQRNNHATSRFHTSVKLWTNHHRNHQPYATATALLTLSVDDGPPRSPTDSYGQSANQGVAETVPVAIPQLTDDQFHEVSYSPILEQTQLLDLTSPPVIDPAIREILNYSPPPLEERFPPPPPLERRFRLPPFLEKGFPLPPFLDQFPTPPSQSNPEPIDWDRLFRLYSSPSTEE
ncbi:hypothetical protein G5I_02510 [Acromyrmex echinatior]|uniref:Uncharacterized protein n=1 Tax=Acromyrmex echinatior TaxID=103372 RepID=F4WAH4_ACREC|nr:hypothetical protein G5I_02510 [Acromyrmex echinatior]